MSRIDRELKSIIDDMAEQANKLLPELFNILLDDDVSEEIKNSKLQTFFEELKPKTYDVYISDIKNVFRNNGWIEPNGDK